MEINRPTAFTPLETRNRTWSGRIIKLAIIGGAVFILLVIAVVLAVVLPRKISYLEYYEYGLKREKDSGFVFLDKVFTGGKYWLGEDYDFLVYRADAYHMNLENVSTFSQDRIELQWNLRFQYFIRYDELKELHMTLGRAFHELITATATDELKKVAASYGILHSRVQFEETLSKALRQSIGGKCCRPNCNQTNYELACYTGCKKHEECTEIDKGYHVDVKQIQLGMAYIPEMLLARIVSSIAMPELVKRERFLQEANEVRKETEMMVRQVKTQTEEIKANATSQRNIIRRNAEYEYISSLERATIKGLQNSINQLNITAEEKTDSLVYIQSLINQGKFRPNITFIYSDSSD